MKKLFPLLILSLLSLPHENAFSQSMTVTKTTTHSAQSVNAESLLLQSARQGDIAGIKQALSEGAKMPTEYLLDIVAESKNIEAIKYVLDGKDATSGIYGAATPMLIVASNGDIPSAKLLAEYKFSVNEIDDQGNTPLMMAAATGNVQMVKFLVENGAEIDTLYTPLEKSALMVAAEHGHIEVMKLLVENGANVNLQADFFVPHTLGSGQNALMYAVLAKQENAVRFLLNNNANIFAQDRQKNTALSYAKQIGNKNIVQSLENYLNPKLNQDNYLESSINRKNDSFFLNFPNSKVTILQKYTGAFSYANARQLLVVYNSGSTMHASGLGTQTLVLFDAVSGLPIAQETIMNDNMELSFIRTKENTNIILPIGFMVYQGYFDNFVNTLSLTNNKLIATNALDQISKLQKSDVSYAYRFLNGNLDLFEQEYNEDRVRTLHYVTTFEWDTENDIFVEKSDNTIRNLRGISLFDLEQSGSLNEWIINALKQSITQNDPILQAWLKQRNVQHIEDYDAYDIFTQLNAYTICTRYVYFASAEEIALSQKQGRMPKAKNYIIQTFTYDGKVLIGMPK